MQLWCLIILSYFTIGHVSCRIASDTSLFRCKMSLPYPLSVPIISMSYLGIVGGVYSTLHWVLLYCFSAFSTLNPMMPRYGMNMGGTRHGYDRDMDFTHKK